MSNGKPGKTGKTTGLFLLHLHVCFITEFLLPVVLDSMHLKQLTNCFPLGRLGKATQHTNKWVCLKIGYIPNEIAI